MKGDERSDEEEEESQDEAQNHKNKRCDSSANGLSNGHWLKTGRLDWEELWGCRFNFMSILGTKTFP